jgi:hypothetical protein
MTKNDVNKLDPAKIHKDPVYFVENVIGMKLVEYQKNWLRMIEEKKRICVMAFRTSGKTSQLFIHYPLWKAVTNPKTQYLVISRTLPQAIEIMKDIRLTVSTNPLLKTLIPRNKSQSWSRTELELNNYSRIISRTYNENVRGLHMDGVMCLTKEAAVVTSDGVKHINEVKKGEMVLTHKNRFRKVLKTYKRKWRGRIYELVTESGVKIRLTAEHPVLVKLGSHKVFRRTERLVPGDYINIPETGTNPVIMYDNHRKWFRLDNNWARFMGFYVAEGSYNDGVRITTNDTKHGFYLNLMKTLFGNVKEYKNHSITDLCHFNRPLGKVFKRWFGNGAKSKKVPNFIFRATRKVQANFLMGVLEGDGHFKDGHCDFTTTSIVLYQQMKVLCDKIGIKVNDRGSRITNGNLGPCKMYRLYFPVQSVAQLNMLINAGKIGAHLQEQITEINEKKSHSHVYNIEVEEDNSYTANLLSLHNCDEIGEYESHETLKKAVLPTIRAKRGFFVGAGTPKSSIDLLHVIESDPGFQSIHFDRFPAMGEKGNLIEQRYPDIRVDERDDSVHLIDTKTNKTIETYTNMAWSQEFMLKPVSMKDQLFPEPMITACLDPSESFQDQPKEMRQYFMGVDFAMSARAGSDYTVVTILEKRPDNPEIFKIVNIERFKGVDYSIQKERIKELAQRFQVTKILGDENSFGRTFIYDLKAECIPIEGYRFTPKSKEEMIRALRDQFEKKGFVIPYADDVVTRITIKRMIDELTKFGIIFDMRSKTVKFEGTGRYDDMVTSLGLATFIARHISMGLFSAIKGTQRGGRSNPFAVSVK